jgi:hypothetical protein
LYITAVSGQSSAISIFNAICIVYSIGSNILMACDFFVICCRSRDNDQHI